MMPVYIYAAILRAIFRTIDRVFAACGHNKPELPTQIGGWLL